MKSSTIFKSIWVITVLMTIASCSNAQQPAPEKNVLIVYLSRTNNTKEIAKIIHQHVGGKLVALELEKPYPENYQVTVQQVAEENATGYLPPLKTKIDSIQKYNVVFFRLSYLANAVAITHEKFFASVSA